MTHRDILLSAFRAGLIDRDGDLSEAGTVALAQAMPEKGLIADYCGGTEPVVLPPSVSRWIVGKIHGQDWWSNGHIAVKGEWPKRDFIENKYFSETILRPRINAAVPVCFFKQDRLRVVVFDCGVSVDADYYDYFVNYFPSCMFWTTEKAATLNIEQGFALVGVMRGLSIVGVPEEFAGMCRGAR